MRRHNDYFRLLCNMLRAKLQERMQLKNQDLRITQRLKCDTICNSAKRMGY